jgi:3-dehydroquinate synthase
MAVDKKVQDGRLRLILLRDLGQGVIAGDVDAGRLRETLEARRSFDPSNRDESPVGSGLR